MRTIMLKYIFLVVLEKFWDFQVSTKCINKIFTILSDSSVEIRTWVQQSHQNPSINAQNLRIASTPQK